MQAAMCVEGRCCMSARAQARYAAVLFLFSYTLRRMQKEDDGYGC